MGRRFKHCRGRSKRHFCRLYVGAGQLNRVNSRIGSMTLERILLCQPQGGLNDILCTIKRACLYAERYNRTVFVDTNFANTEYMKDDFSNYFKSRDKNVYLNLSPIAHMLSHLTTFPKCIASRISGYCAHFDRRLGMSFSQSSASASLRRRSIRGLQLFSVNASRHGRKSNFMNSRRR